MCRELVVTARGLSGLQENLSRGRFCSKKWASPTERSVNYKEISTVGKRFNVVNTYEFYLTSMAKKIIRNGMILKILQKIDDILFRLCPFLKRYCYWVVIEYVKYS